MKKNIPLAIVFILGIGFIIQFFIPSRPSQSIFNTMVEWDLILYVFASIIAVDSLIRHHVIKISRKTKGWGYSTVYLGAVVFMVLAAVFSGTREDSFYMKVFYYTLAPMQSTMFAILAFYMASASYRAFRAKSLEATLLLISAFIVMIGLIPQGAAIWSGFPKLSEWLMQVPNMAAKRGITFGIGLGATATSLKIILGIERNWMGGH
ncbi:hypothetical protein HY768_02665 [candidate division TA06 bacterium]|uniref:Uncharacterized protein n=1 Tax=candidate division TA06 bacterium TaxID=2250710 RepID=A0A933I8D7_UNCT6|nr:hypothetical protein [candidate division TA06 bacterium]